MEFTKAVLDDYCFPVSSNDSPTHPRNIHLGAPEGF